MITFKMGFGKKQGFDEAKIPKGCCRLKITKSEKIILIKKVDEEENRCLHLRD